MVTINGNIYEEVEPYKPLTLANTYTVERSRTSLYVAQATDSIFRHLSGTVLIGRDIGRKENVGVRAPLRWMKHKYQLTTDDEVQAMLSRWWPVHLQMFCNIIFGSLADIQTVSPNKVYFLETYTKMRPIVAIKVYMSKVYDIDLNEAQVSALNILIEKLLQPETTRIGISKGCRGDSGLYANGGSCWWDGYSNSRNIVEGNNGGAVLVFSDDASKWNEGTVKGRAWYMTAHVFDQDILVLFNNYGGFSGNNLEVWGNSLKDFFGFSHAVVNPMPTSHLSSMFVNNTRCIVFSNQKLTEGQLRSLQDYSWGEKQVYQYSTPDSSYDEDDSNW